MPGPDRVPVRKSQSVDQRWFHVVDAVKTKTQNTPGATVGSQLRVPLFPVRFALCGSATLGQGPARSGCRLFYRIRPSKYISSRIVLPCLKGTLVAPSNSLRSANKRLHISAGGKHEVSRIDSFDGNDFFYDTKGIFKGRAKVTMFGMK